MNDLTFFGLIVGGILLIGTVVILLADPDILNSEIREQRKIDYNLKQKEISNMLKVARYSTNCRELQDLQLDIISNWPRHQVQSVWDMASERYGVMCP